ncbi:MAG: purN [Bacteroidetes bacterium]|jgi:phosphoribosylglycinamide formyltransferase-1|nr:purN [Bacteroidota bacterium]
MKKNIAIFASGEGTNAQRIIDYFKDSDTFCVSIVVSNKPDAPVLKRADKAGIAFHVIKNKTEFYDTCQTIDILKAAKTDLIVLAGFLWMIPDNLIKAFPDKIINIHPALLPKFGGKGMYGMNVHKAVITAGENESGISIHYVNENYDEGKIISQHKCEITKSDTPESLSQKIQQLEHEFFPQIIEKLLSVK